jgi:hypothetical protein
MNLCCTRERISARQMLNRLVELLNRCALDGDPWPSVELHTAEYAGQLRQAGLMVERRRGNPLYTFPPLRIVIARKSQLSLR